MNGNWKRAAILTLVVLLFAGARLYFLWRQRHAAFETRVPARSERRLTDDDVVSIRKMHIDSVASARALAGKTVWMQVGYQVPAYRFSGGRVEFDRRQGLLPPLTRLDIAAITEQAAPAREENRIPHGTRQVFAVFRQPGQPGEFALPIGCVEGAGSSFFADQLFFYDDPHRLYKHWPAEVWAAVDAHRPLPGMNELQVMMALGQRMQSDSSSLGNRTVHYDADGRLWTVTFAQDRAVKIEQN